MQKKARSRLLLFAIVAAVFIPTYVAIISFIVIDSMPKPVNMEGYEISVTDPDGTVLDLEGQDKVKEMFLIMRRDATEAPLPSNTSSAHTFRAAFAKDGTTDEYEFLFYPDGMGYMTSKDKSYKLTSDSVKSFLCTPHAARMYEGSVFPTLTTARGERITPDKASWKYAACGGTLVEREIPASDKIENYYHAGHIGLNFSIEPSSLEITVISDDGEIYNSFVENENRSLEYLITATWLGNEYEGSAEYRFYSHLGLAAEFQVSLGLSDGRYADFILINAQNISDVTKLSLEMSPSPGINVRFFANNGSALAIIPISHRTENGRYTLSAIYEDIEYDLGEVEITKRGTAPSQNKYPAKESAKLDAAYLEYKALLRDIGKLNEETVYMKGAFTAPDSGDSGATLFIGYGREVSVTDSDEYYVTDGVEYTASGSVTAINGGKVVKTGYCEWLGNYVVVDHGLGLKSWYCHLSGTDVSEGKIVTKNESIGTAAKTGYTPNPTTGFYLIVTSNGVPMSPYALFETDILDIGFEE